MTIWMKLIPGGRLPICFKTTITFLVQWEQHNALRLNERKKCHQVAVLVCCPYALKGAFKLVATSALSASDTWRMALEHM